MAAEKRIGARRRPAFPEAFGALRKERGHSPSLKAHGDPVRRMARNAYLVFFCSSSNAACAAASRATGTRNGEQET